MPGFGSLSESSQGSIEHLTSLLFRKAISFVSTGMSVSGYAPQVCVVLTISNH